MSEAHPMSKDPRFQNLVGRKFGKLTVEAYAGKNGIRHYWLCRCECGGCIKSSGNNLRGGGAFHCGCVKVRKPYKHGECSSLEYHSWSSMIERCCNEKHPQYSYYGGRGITICRRWRESFASFLSDMGKRPSPKHSIDRIDNNGNYCPENCRWATSKQQSRNRRSNILLSHNGIIATAAEWEEIMGINQNLICRRIKAGWPADKALTTPPDSRNRITSF